MQLAITHSVLLPCRSFAFFHISVHQVLVQSFWVTVPRTICRWSWRPPRGIRRFGSCQRQLHDLQGDPARTACNCQPKRTHQPADTQVWVLAAGGASPGGRLAVHRTRQDVCNVHALQHLPW